MPLIRPRPGAGRAWAFALALAAAPAPAQVLSPNHPGTAGAPLATPDFATPATPSPLVATPAPIAPAGGLHLTDVAVAGEAARAPRARHAGDAAADAVTGLRLAYATREALDAAWIRRQFALNGLIGADVGYDRIAALVERINLAFLANGYLTSGVLVAAPPMGARAGVLYLRLVTGRLVAAADGGDAAAVTWAGGHRRGLDAAYVRRRMRAATADPLNLDDVERDFRRLADDAAIRTVTADLRPGAAPGEASLALRVDPAERFDLYAEYANSRSPSVGGERVSGGGSVRNALAAGDLASADFGSTRGLTDLTVAYAAPLVDPRLTIAGYGGFNNAAVIDRPLIPLNIYSREYFAEGDLRWRLFADPLLPAGTGQWRAARSASLGVGFVHRRVTATLLGEPFSFSPGAVDGRTEYSAARVTADFTRRSPTAVLAVALTGTVGLQGTRAGIAGSVEPSPNFTALLIQANYARRLDADRLELRLRLAGQGSGGLLYSPERLAVGGRYTVRGYRESLLLADEGVIGSIELAQPFDLLRSRGADWGRFVLAAFADGALVHNRAGPQPVPTAIASVGATLDWRPAAWFSATLTYGHPLRHVTITGDRDIQDESFQFRLTLRPIAAVHALL